MRLGFIVPVLLNILFLAHAVLGDEGPTLHGEAAKAEHKLSRDRHARTATTPEWERIKVLTGSIKSLLDVTVASEIDRRWFFGQIRHRIVWIYFEKDPLTQDEYREAIMRAMNTPVQNSVDGQVPPQDIQAMVMSEIFPDESMLVDTENLRPVVSQAFEPILRYSSPHLLTQTVRRYLYLYYFSRGKAQSGPIVFSKKEESWVAYGLPDLEKKAVMAKINEMQGKRRRTKLKEWFQREDGKSH